MDCVHDTFYMCGMHTDHSAFFLGLDMEAGSYERGPGFWKFNSSLLQNTEFVNQMNQKIDAVVMETKDCDVMTRWECLKDGIRKFSKEYTRGRTSENNLIISQLSEVVRVWEEKIDTLK